MSMATSPVVPSTAAFAVSLKLAVRCRRRGRRGERGWPARSLAYRESKLVSPTPPPSTQSAVALLKPHWNFRRVLARVAERASPREQTT